MVLGFEPTTFGARVSSHNHQARAPAQDAFSLLSFQQQNQNRSLLKNFLEMDGRDQNCRKQIISFPDTPLPYLLFKNGQSQTSFIYFRSFQNIYRIQIIEMSGIQTRPIGVKVSMLTFCLTGLDSTKLVNLYLIQRKQAAVS